MTFLSCNLCFVHLYLPCKWRRQPRQIFDLMNISTPTLAVWALYCTLDISTAIARVKSSFIVSYLYIGSLFIESPFYSSGWAECSWCNNQSWLQIFLSSGKLIHKDREVCQQCRCVDQPDFCGLYFTWQVQMVLCSVHLNSIALDQWSAAWLGFTNVQQCLQWVKKNKSLAQRNAECSSLDPGEGYTPERLELCSLLKEGEKGRLSFKKTQWNRFKPRKP